MNDNNLAFLVEECAKLDKLRFPCTENKNIFADFTDTIRRLIGENLYLKIKIERLENKLNGEKK